MTGFDPVVFDLDGTVVDTVELIRESFRHASRTVLGEVLPDEVILAGVGQPLMTQMRELRPIGPRSSTTPTASTTTASTTR